jgi:hypothetical protein
VRSETNQPCARPSTSPVGCVRLASVRAAQAVPPEEPHDEIEQDSRDSKPQHDRRHEDAKAVDGPQRWDRPESTEHQERDKPLARHDGFTLH